MLVRIFAHLVLIGLALGSIVSIRNPWGFYGPILVLAVTYLIEGIIIWRFKKIKSSPPIRKNELPPSIVGIVAMLWISVMLLLIPVYFEGLSAIVIIIDLGIFIIVGLFGIGIWGELKKIIRLWKLS